MTTQYLNKNDHLLLTLEYPPFCGGVGTYLFNLFSVGDYQILVNGHEVGQRQFFYKYFWPKWLKIFFYLWRKSTSFKVLHVSHVLPLGYVAYLLKIFARKKYVIYLHGLDFNLLRSGKWKAYWGKRILQSASLIVTNSQFLQSEVKNFLGDDLPSMEVIYPAPHRELSRLAAASSRLEKMETLRQKYQISSDDQILLSVGRLVERKGHALVLQALGENWPSNLKYFIVGRGPEEANLRQLIALYHLEKQVFILSNVDKNEDLADFYGLADLFVLPTLELGSDVEGFGIVFIEAGLFGKALLVGQGRGVAEAVKHNETGIIVDDPRDLAKLRENVLNLLNNDDLRQRLAEANRLWSNKFIYLEDYLWKILQKHLN